MKHCSVCEVSGSGGRSDVLPFLNAGSSTVAGERNIATGKKVHNRKRKGGGSEGFVVKPPGGSKEGVDEAMMVLVGRRVLFRRGGCWTDTAQETKAGEGLLREESVASCWGRTTLGRSFIGRFCQSGDSRSSTIFLYEIRMHPKQCSAENVPPNTKTLAVVCEQIEKNFHLSPSQYLTDFRVPSPYVVPFLSRDQHSSVAPGGGRGLHRATLRSIDYCWT